MKSSIIILATIIFCFSLTSCTKEYEAIESEANCTLSFRDHPKDEALTEVLKSYTSAGFVGMTLLSDDPDDGLWIGSSGYANIEQDIKMNPCHLHHSASLYKTFIATIILQLKEEGALSLDDKLSKYIGSEIIDKLPNGNQLNLKHLLQQRSGIPDIFEVEFITQFFNHPNSSYSIEELLKYVYDKDPLSEPGTDFYYSDANFSLLTLVIESIEGSTADALSNRIFSPLNLMDTYFIEDPEEAPESLVNSYWDRYGNGEIENNTDTQIALTTGLSGSDGIIISANDLKVFIKALADGLLVNDISQMIEFIDVSVEQQAASVYKGYGMGLMQVSISGEEWYGHFGNQIGSGAIMLYNPERDVTMIALQNTGTFFSDEIKGKFFYELLRDFEDVVL